MTEEKTPFDDGALYDLFFERFDLGLDFYLGLAKAARGPVLDVACGTGQHSAAVPHSGGRCRGVGSVSRNADTLAREGVSVGIQPALPQADMAKFGLPRRFALIMIPFNAFGHNLTTGAQRACRQAGRDHLQPGGLLAFDACFSSLQ